MTAGRTGPAPCRSCRRGIPGTFLDWRTQRLSVRFGHVLIRSTPGGLAFRTGAGALRPEDVTKHALPVVMRGYDRGRTDRLLERISEAYLRTWRDGAALRERLGALEEELAAVQGEAEASSKSVAELIQRCSTAGDQLAQTRQSRDELAAKLDAAERDRKRAVTELREVSERASDLERRLNAYGNVRQRQGGEAERPGEAAGVDREAATLLVAAARAAEDVREASRARALRTLIRARERAAQLRDEAERERAAVAEMLERREQAEREANEIRRGVGGASRTGRAGGAQGE